MGQAKPGAWNSFLVSHVRGRGSSTGHPPLLSQAVNREPGQKWSIWDASIADNHLTGNATMSGPKTYFYRRKNIGRKFKIWVLFILDIFNILSIQKVLFPIMQ